MDQKLEVWQRGAVEDVSPQLQPVAHALMQASEDLARLAASLSDELVHAQPGGGAPVSFHLRHLAGSLDRLMTYARGEELGDAQWAALALEKENPRVTVAELVDLVQRTIERALQQVRSTSENSLEDARVVGRAKLPSTVRYLLFHAGEHTARHVGQAISTTKIAKGLET